MIMIKMLKLIYLNSTFFISFQLLLSMLNLLINYERLCLYISIFLIQTFYLCFDRNINYLNMIQDFEYSVLLFHIYISKFDD
jgi:hypothetical protein